MAQEVTIVTLVWFITIRYEVCKAPNKISEKTVSLQLSLPAGDIALLRELNALRGGNFKSLSKARL